MLYRPGILAFFMAMCIAIASGILSSLLLKGYAVADIVVIFLMIFITAFSAIYFVLQKFFFTQIKQMKRRLESFSEDYGSEENALQDNGENPFDKVTDDIESILKRKQGEIERLKKTEAFRKDFIADVSHELKTPIFAAQGFVHTLLDGAVKEKAVRKKFLKKAAKSLDGLDMLVQDLLTLSHIETGQIKMRFREVDLYLLAEDVLEQLKGKAKKKNITLQIEGPVRKVIVYADGPRIGQVLTNLISNAIKYSEDESEVVVAFSVRKKSVVTRVKDQGEGIAAEHINRIFERFYRVDKSRSREKGGTGLGLAIVKHILDGHGSKAEVESEPGKGSTFSFSLPRTRTEDNGITEHHKSAGQ